MPVLEAGLSVDWKHPQLPVSSGELRQGTADLVDENRRTLSVVAGKPK